MLVDTSRQGHLVLGLGTSGSGQGDLCQISLDTQNTSSNLRCSDVDEELLSCGQLLNLYLCEKMVVDSVFESLNKPVCCDQLAFACFLSVVFTPNNRRSKKTISSTAQHMSLDETLPADSPLTADLQLDIDIRTLSDGGHDVTQQLVTLAEDGVHQGTDTDKTSGNGELQIVALGKERDDSGSQGLTNELSGLIGKDLTRSDLDFLSDLRRSSGAIKHMH
jgi:hypothetical protein